MLSITESVFTSFGGEYTIIARQPGIYYLNYTVSVPPTQFLTPEDTIIMIYGQRSSASDKYFRTLGLSNGQLSLGCCANKLHLKPHHCVSTITLHSSCRWVSNQNGHVTSDGVIFLTVNSLTLPLSIIGIQYNTTKSTLVFKPNQPTNSCLPCSDEKSCVHYNNFGMDSVHSFLNYDSLLLTFLTSVESFLPSWLSVEIYSTTSVYSRYNYMASLASPNTLSGCNLLPYLFSKCSLHYLIKTTSQLLFTVNSHPFIVLPTDDNPHCFIIDLCHERFPKLYASLPISLKRPSDTIEHLQKLLNDNAEVNFKYIALEENHLLQKPLMNLDQYWNGEHYFFPDLPNYFEYKLALNFTKTFFGGNLNVLMKFDGDVYFQSTIEANEVPGLTIGLLILNITTIINNQHVSFILTSNNPAFFSYPGTPSSLLAGLPTGLTGNFNLSNELYIDHHLSFLPNNCNAHVFLSLNDEFSVNFISLSTSNCVNISIADFAINDGFRQTALFTGLTTPIESKSLIVDSQPASSFPHRLNNFAKISNPNKVRLLYESSSNNVEGIIPVNLTFLNTTFFANIATTNLDTIRFTKKIKIFDNYDVLVHGTFTSTKPNMLELNGIFVSEFLQNTPYCNITSFISQHIHTEIESTVRKRDLTNVSVALSTKWKENLYNILQTKIASLNQANNSYSDANLTYTNQKSLVDDIQEEIVSNSTLYATFDSACELSCDYYVKVKCDAIKNQAAIEVSIPCTMLTLGNKTIEELLTNTVKQWQHKQQCSYCWKFTQYKLLYLSQDICCIDIKAPVEVQNIVEHYIQTEVNDTVQTSCVAPVINEFISDITCSAINTYTDNQTACILECNENELPDSNFFQMFINETMHLQHLKSELLKKKFILDQSEEEIALLSLLYLKSFESNQINFKSNQTLSNISVPFINTLYSFSLEEVLNTNISLSLLLVNMTPTEFSIKFDYYNQLTGNTDYVNVLVDFLKPCKYLLRQISRAILESHLEQNHTLYETKDRHYFYGTCLELKRMKTYIAQILKSFKYSYANYNETKTLILNAFKNNEDIFGKDAAIDSPLISLLEVIDANFFGLWQAQMESIHVNSSQAELFDCHSYLECVENLLKQFQHIIEDTEHEFNTNQILHEIKSIRDDILRIAYDKWFGYNDTHLVLEKLLNILDTKSISDYWCVEQPIVINKLSSSSIISVQAGSSLNLFCPVTSSLNVKHYWVKNGIIIPFANSAFLNMTNIQESDSGKYHCVAWNNAGSSSSLPCNVNVVVLPTFTETLPSSTTVFEGDENGVHMRCNAVGSPAPGWMWYYRQNEQDNWHMIQGENSNTLSIRNPQFDDQGWYRCTSYYGNITISGPPTHLNVLSSTFAQIKYSFIIELVIEPHINEVSGFEVETIAQEISDTANIYSTISDISIELFGDDAWLLHFSIKTDELPLISNLTSAIFLHNLEVEKLEQDKDSLFERVMGSIIPMTFHRKSYTISVSTINAGPRTFICPSGFELASNNLYCVACSAGHFNGKLTNTEFTHSGDGRYIEELMPKCTRCPVGTYQNASGQVECVECPANYSTLTDGCTTLEQCQELCPPHTFSPTGFVMCNACAPLHYQLHRGQRWCNPCTDASNTDICAGTQIILFSNIFDVYFY
jgi:hypothetical protein